MTRVATFAMHQALFGAIGRSQGKLAAAQLHMATGKKATDFAALGPAAASTLSARSLLARQDAYKGVAERLGTTLALQDMHLSGVEEAVSSLRTKLLSTVGTGQSAGLQGAIEEAFGRFRTGLNADEAGRPLFAGSKIDAKAFAPSTLDEIAGMPAAAAFANDDVKASAKVEEGQDLTFGITASEIGSKLFTAFRTLAEAGAIGNTPTAAQRTAIESAAGQINDGLQELRAVWAENGRRQAQVEAATVRSDERGLILQELISRNEDANMAEVASTLTSQQAALEASYAVFARLSGLSLVNFLR